MFKNLLYFCANIIYHISTKVVNKLDTKERIRTLAENNNGVLKTADVVAAGISKKTFAEFVKDNGLEKVSHGIYCEPDSWTDALYLLQLRCPLIVFSHDTALFLHDLTDREPLLYSVTAKTGYNPSRLTKDGVKVYTIRKELFEVGLTAGITPYGNPVRVYDMERTICDLIRSRNSIEAQVLQDAMKRYVLRKDKNLHRLMEYAGQFHVDRILRQYMEVLL